MAFVRKSSEEGFSVFPLFSCTGSACIFAFPFYVCVYMCAYTRPREIHNVGLFAPVSGSVKKCSHSTAYFPATYRKHEKFPQKIVAQKLQNRKKCVPLQPLSRGRAAENDRLVKRGRLSKALHPSILPCKTAREREKDKPGEVLLKNSFEKTSKKFGGKEKTPYLCKRFPAENGSTKER